jgi:hypothetical protein
MQPPKTHLPRLMILAAIWQQIAPFGPVLADSAGRKSFKNQRPAATLLPWHGRGRRFEPDQVHQFFKKTEWGPLIHGRKGPASDSPSEADRDSRVRLLLDRETIY